MNFGTATQSAFKVDFFDNPKNDGYANMSAYSDEGRLEQIFQSHEHLEEMYDEIDNYDPHADDDSDEEMPDYPSDEMVDDNGEEEESQDDYLQFTASPMMQVTTINPNTGLMLQTATNIYQQPQPQPIPQETSYEVTDDSYSIALMHLGLQQQEQYVDPLTLTTFIDTDVEMTSAPPYEEGYNEFPYQDNNAVIANDAYSDVPMIYEMGEEHQILYQRSLVDVTAGVTQESTGSSGGPFLTMDEVDLLVKAAYSQYPVIKPSSEEGKSVCTITSGSGDCNVESVSVGEITDSGSTSHQEVLYQKPQFYAPRNNHSTNTHQVQIYDNRRNNDAAANGHKGPLKARQQAHRDKFQRQRQAPHPHDESHHHGYNEDKCRTSKSQIYHNYMDDGNGWLDKYYGPFTTFNGITYKSHFEGIRKDNDIYSYEENRNSSKFGFKRYGRKTEDTRGLNFYEPLVFRYHTEDKGFAKHARYGLCPYCIPTKNEMNYKGDDFLDAYFYEMNNSGYLHHVTKHHGVFSNGCEMPYPAALGKAREYKDNKTGKVVNVIEAAECPSCHKTIKLGKGDSGNCQLLGYFRHLLEHNKGYKNPKNNRYRNGKRGRGRT